MLQQSHSNLVNYKQDKFVQHFLYLEVRLRVGKALHRVRAAKNSASAEGQYWLQSSVCKQWWMFVTFLNNTFQDLIKLLSEYNLIIINGKGVRNHKNANAKRLFDQRFQRNPNFKHRYSTIPITAVQLNVFTIRTKLNRHFDHSSSRWWNWNPVVKGGKNDRDERSNMPFH